MGSCLLLALREHAAAQEALCLLLEWQIVQSEDQRVQIATTLQSTPTGYSLIILHMYVLYMSYKCMNLCTNDLGRANYLALCGRQQHLKELVSHVLISQAFLSSHGVK